MNNPIPTTPALRMVAWELTRSCPLSCVHCRAAAHAEAYENELSTQECFRVIDSLSSFAKPVVILTGGEPLLRNDVFDIARYGTGKGLRMVLATCGTLLTKEVCLRLKDSGIMRLSFSIDGASEEAHDTFRGVKGAYKAVIKAISIAKSVGMEFQINTTVSKVNMNDLPEIFAFAESLGAASFHPFMLVPTGRGKEIADKIISPIEYENILRWICDNASKSNITLKPTCAPHYTRVCSQKKTIPVPSHPHAEHGLEGMSKGCLGGQGFVFLSHVGILQICGFLDVPAGNIRESEFDFKALWENAPLFNDVRNPDRYKGKCRRCNFLALCGGCRARAYWSGNDYMAEEPSCVYTPA